MYFYIKSRFWPFVKNISSLRFSIGLFLILACASITGTIIEQDQSLEYYRENYPDNYSVFKWLSWKQIIGLELNHVYSSNWFLLILLLFFFSLFLCTLSTQLPILQRARRWNFLSSKAAIENKGHYSNFNCCSLPNLTLVLSSKKYCVFHKGQALYAHKGLIGRLAPIFVHLGIIFTLLGSVFGFINGFTAQEMVPTGETFHVQNFVKSGYCSSATYNYLGRVDDFFITLNPDNSVQQFFSAISIVDSYGDVFLNRLVSVNTPLKFKGLTFYQTDWRIAALRFKIGSSGQLVKTLSSGMSNTRSPFWFLNLSIDRGNKLIVVIPGLSDELLIYDSQGLLISTTHYGLCNVIYGTPIVFKDLVASTGLQIKADPGIHWAYFGFLILIVSILLSYTSYSQIWASEQTSMLYIAGETNRALLSFENEIALIQKTYAHLDQSAC